MDTIPLVGEGVSADTIKQLMESVEAAFEQQRQAAEAVFAKACTEAVIAMVESGAMLSGQPSVAWRVAIGQCEDVVPEKVLFSDLVVLPVPDSKWPVRKAHRSTLAKTTNSPTGSI